MRRGGGDLTEGTQLISGKIKVTIPSSQPRLFSQWHWLCCRRRRKEPGILNAGLPPVALPAFLPMSAGAFFQGLEKRGFYVEDKQNEWV